MILPNGTELFVMFGGYVNATIVAAPSRQIWFFRPDLQDWFVGAVVPTNIRLGRTHTIWCDDGVHVSHTQLNSDRIVTLMIISILIIHKIYMVSGQPNGGCTAAVPDVWRYNILTIYQPWHQQQLRQQYNSTTRILGQQTKPLMNLEML